MRRLWALWLGLLACGPAAPSSTFEADDDGWTLGGNGATKPELRAAGGNPGGHLCAMDAVSGDLWYFIAPVHFLGDASRAFGLRLTWDLKQDQMFQQIKGRDVVLQGNGLSVVFNIRATPAREWTPYQVRIDGASGWKLDQDPDFPAATEAQLKTLLRNVTSLRLRGEFADGPDGACLDNVYFGVP